MLRVFSVVMVVTEKYNMSDSGSVYLVDMVCNLTIYEQIYIVYDYFSMLFLYFYKQLNTVLDHCFSLLPKNLTSTTIMAGQSEVQNSTQDPIILLKHNIDDLFHITMGCFVFFMQPGFAFLEAGSVR